MEFGIVVFLVPPPWLGMDPNIGVRSALVSPGPRSSHSGLRRVGA